MFYVDLFEWYKDDLNNIDCCRWNFNENGDDFFGRLLLEVIIIMILIISINKKNLKRTIILMIRWFGT